jgi:hypothetical protein
VSTYREQLKRARAAATQPQPQPAARRVVRAGEPFDGSPGEELDVVSDVDGVDMLVGRIVITEPGKFTVG